MSPLVIRSARDAIAAVPYMLGFHPSRSLVVIGFDGPPNTCAVRLDLPVPQKVADRASGMLGANGFRRALLLGYGAPDEVAVAAVAMRAALTAAGVDAAEAIRVDEHRWWSLTCDDDCCPAEGTPYDIAGSVVAAQATFAGHVVLADRDELVRSVQPVPETPALRAATDRAEKRFLARAREPSARFRSKATEEGIAFVAGVLARDGLTDDEIAWLGVLLTDRRVRDEAWIRIDEDAPADDIRFWRDVTRRVRAPYAAGPAALLAYAAYAGGDGGLANIALDRALDADPGYSMAVLLRQVITSGIPPSKARMRMTPGELAAAYDEKG
ncbi:DUF4192 domain-containing protein [Actinomadura sp. WMMB 499]|uniref:DUF4192 domain-containing protein n=1 Tax=Actinomadura sp. WMMB 499 TaxID=1219491 RepID=UPI001246BCE5|nr:DUF4192 domain-containing protein [Actinomadura sp. WMMB 499]QFG21045.1 DUF4192 domain-containing protein [Actinomadura sp. WMMB 499]